LSGNANVHAGNPKNILRSNTMSSINSVGGNSPIQRPTAPGTTNPTTSTSTNNTSRPADKVDLSGTSHLLHSLKSNDIRTDKVAAVKSQIANGTYEDDHKLNGTLDGLLDDLLK
jgi:anti-sigma28 factor (negative regulator of flagellin synthesis)